MSIPNLIPPSLLPGLAWAVEALVHDRQGAGKSNPEVLESQVF